MKTKITLLITFCLLMANIAYTQKMNPPHELIREKMETLHIPGVSVCCIAFDTVVWNHNYGYAILEDSLPVADSTLFNVFSIGKSFTASTLMQVYENELIGLDDNVNNVVPFNIDNPWQDIDSITPRMIMTHTSSIRDNNMFSYMVLGDPTESLGDFYANYLDPTGSYYFNNNFYTSIPGEVYHYSNFGVGLNAHVVELLTATDFRQYIHDSVFAPLEMNRSCFFLEDLNIENLAVGYDYSGGTYTPNLHYGGAAYPGVFMRSSALEVANYVIALLNEGVFNNTEVFKSSTIDSICTVQNPSISNSGLGLYHTQLTSQGDSVWGHNGGGILGYANHMYFFPEENTGVVITTNSGQYIWDVVVELFEYAEYLRDSISVGIQDNNLIPIQTTMSIYPNPVESNTNINIQLSQKSKVKLEIFDISGRLVSSILNNEMEKGKHIINFKQTDLISGIYFCRLQAGDEVITQKIVKM
ncbi:MAG: serine hydrolase [Bacteroidales bacterium]|nr:serine hydrolase [Bacteroidales bacterium]